MWLLEDCMCFLEKVYEDLVPIFLLGFLTFDVEFYEFFAYSVY